MVIGSIMTNKEQNNRLMFEVAGSSTSDLKVPVGFIPLANLLHYVNGTAQRARVLSWVQTEGLMAASINRDKLLQDVKKELANKAIKGSVAEARNIIPHLAPRMNGTELTVHDLFSKTAWKRLFEKGVDLYSVRINGMGILGYYRSTYEPRSINVPDTSTGKMIIYDLVKLNELLSRNGQIPFHFGGFDGYIQFVEKGDYLEDHEKRAVISPNKQYGFDVSPEKVLDKATGQLRYADDIRGYNNGKPVFNFQGGSITFDQQRARSVIVDMQYQFEKIANAIEGGQKPNEYSDEELEQYKKYLQLSNEIEKRTIRGSDVEAVNKAADLGFPEYGKSGVQSMQNLPSVVGGKFNVEDFKEVLKAGLASTFTRNLNTFKDKGDAKQGIQGGDIYRSPQWDLNQPSNSSRGWISIDNANNKVSFQFSKSEVDSILNFIFKDYDSDGKIITNFRLNSIPEFKRVNNAVKINLSKLINRGLEQRSDLANKIERNRYFRDDVSLKEFTYVSGNEKLEVDPYNPKDPIISELENEFGFKWSESKIKVKANADVRQRAEIKALSNLKLNPLEFYRAYKSNKLGAVVNQLIQQGIVKLPTEAFLENGVYSYPVALDANDGKWYIYIPNGTRDQAILQAAYGDTGRAALAANPKGRVSGGDPTGHLNAMPTDPELWKKLEQQLLLGKEGILGESGGPYQNLADINSVRKAVNMTFLSLKRNNESTAEIQEALADKAKMISLKGDFASQAAAYLPFLANDRAFQIGWVTDAELKHLSGGQGKKGIDLDKESEKHLNTPLGADDGEAGKKKGKKNGMGIFAIMHKHGVSDQTTDSARLMRDEILRAISNIASDNGDILGALKQWGEEVGGEQKEMINKMVTVLAENGMEWRATMLSRYLISTLQNDIRNYKRIRQGYSDEESSWDSDVADNDKVSSVGNANVKDYLKNQHSPAEFLNKFGKTYQQGTYDKEPPVNNVEPIKSKSREVIPTKSSKTQSTPISKGSFFDRLPKLNTIKAAVPATQVDTAPVAARQNMQPNPKAHLFDRLPKLSTKPVQQVAAAPAPAQIKPNPKADFFSKLPALSTLRK